MPRHDTARKPSTRKRMFWMLLAALVIFGGIFGIKWFSGKMMNQFFDTMPQPPVTVTAVEARAQNWTESLEAVGTLVAVNGTDVTTEAGGVVSAIHFEAGQPVKAGTVLLQLNTSTEVAMLKSLEAAAKLAVTQRNRYRELGSKRVVARSDVDQRDSEAASTLAQADAQRALIAQKTIRAPFTGVLGIRKVNLGQYLNPGDAIVSLQSLDPIYLDFTLPEQRLAEVREGATVHAGIDALSGQSFEGAITAIEPEVDPNTRNFTLQATLRNPGNKLRPGTFARVSFDVGGAKKVIVIPQTAVSFNPYGNSVYVITQAPADKQNAQPAPAEGEAQAQGASQGPPLIVKQRFIKTGSTRGDLIAVTDGLKPDERIATSGLLKLRNDAVVIVNNKVQPTTDAKPTVENR